jgi:hypothetical protein
LAHNGFLGIIQEIGSFVILGDNKNAADGPDKGDYAFEDIEPV